MTTGSVVSYHTPSPPPVKTDVNQPRVPKPSLRRNMMSPVKSSSRHTPNMPSSYSRSRPATLQSQPNPTGSKTHLHSPKLSKPSTDAVPSSPNYFGPAAESTRDSYEFPGSGARYQPNPSASSVKSFTAALPTQVPLNVNPEFEAFKRQADLNRGKSFAFATSQWHPPTSSTPPVRPQATRWHTDHAGETTSNPFSRPVNTTNNRSFSKMDIDSGGLVDSAYVSSDSKHASRSSLVPEQALTLPRHESLPPMDNTGGHSDLPASESRTSRSSLKELKPDPSSLKLEVSGRSSTLPNPLDKARHPSMITTARLKELTKSMGEDRLLLLDIRSASSYAQARIRGALNLCIPTTLLKRPAFNTQKLQQTFQKDSNATKFSQWRDMEWIVVYDAYTSEAKDATTAQNMMKKFTNEGYTGNACILHGGFSVLTDEYPDLIDESSLLEEDRQVASHTSQGSLAPVIGGVRMPSTQNEPNPFFSNIRQNIDLADGVGQLKITPPEGIDSRALPQWLRAAADESDHGKQVSDKFLAIEKDEQSRMRGAYAAFNANNPQREKQVQLCGVERGVKNRYKDILPFEHARVKLQSGEESDSDYVNASFIKASRSNKRYIATQGPLPTTFNDFWSVVWEEDVRVIVMLTAETEGGQLKCHQYWKEIEYGPIRLQPLSEQKASLDIDKHRPSSTFPVLSAGGENVRRRASTTTMLDSTGSTVPAIRNQPEAPFVLVRRFAMSHSAYPFEPIREITHLHFPSWPDFGTPAQPSHLLALVELANTMQHAALPMDTASAPGPRRNSGEAPPSNWHDEPVNDPHAQPMLVHCSAGCGRTGAFCTVDSVIDMLKRQRVEQAATHRPRDAEGDTAMMDLDDAIPPKGQRDVSFQKTATPRKNIGRRAYSSSPPIDTSWVGDGAVDLIQKTVEDFRGQRLSMVQSLRQFVLCYETILEWAHQAQSRAPTRGRARSGSLQQPKV